MLTTKSVVLVALLGCCMNGACAPSRISLRVAVEPSPVPVALVVPCGGAFAGLGCGARSYLLANFTVRVSARNDVGGVGTLSVRAMDALTGAPLPSAQVSGEMAFELAPGGTVVRPIAWKWEPAESSGQVPATLALVVRVEVTDSLGNRVSESATVQEVMPRNWHVF